MTPTTLEALKETLEAEQAEINERLTSAPIRLTAGFARGLMEAIT